MENSNEQAYVNQCQAWMENQALAIKSSEINIDYLQKKIENDQLMLEAERKELELKHIAMETVRKNTQEVIDRIEKTKNL
jgi:hypothetical protein